MGVEEGEGRGAFMAEEGKGGGGQKRQRFLGRKGLFLYCKALLPTERRWACRAGGRKGRRVGEGGMEELISLVQTKRRTF